MKKGHLIVLTIICIATSFMGAFVYGQFFSAPSIRIVQSTSDAPPTQQVDSRFSGNIETGFITASKNSTPSVVFIKTESQQYQRNSFWGFGFDPFGRVGKVASSGSGVIISNDGYIVTNHHVIKNADKIEVVLSQNKKTLKATLIGADPSSDLALLKIESSELSPIEFANSDEVQIGQWVLAVGNPFNLTSTVTAGIVSAKGRNINIVNNQFPIESFIQTDAAINPGNSGGALVDLKGRLIGVNTAIASKTGSYVGYGFAIPSNIVSKIIEDLKNYGEVQRAILGIDVIDIGGETQETLGVTNGVLIKRITNSNDEATKKLAAGDVITAMDGTRIDTKSTYDEQLAYLRPGDIVKLTIQRNEKSSEVDITLVNKEGNTALLQKNSKVSSILGAEFEKLSKLERTAYNLPNGIKTYNITSGKIRKMNISEGFIFVKINNKLVTDIDDLIDYLETYKGQIRIEGRSASGQNQYFSFTFR